MLKILYGCCNNELTPETLTPARPKWFSKITCFNSIHKNILDSPFKEEIELIAFMDGDKSLLSDHIEGLGYKVIYNKFLSGPRSFRYRLAFAENEINDSDVYFLEDDYIHQKNAMDYLFPAISHFGLVSGYNCSWYHGYDDIRRPCEPIPFAGIFWETVVGVSLTWAVSKEQKKRMLDHQKNYQTDTTWSDYQMFRDLYRNPDISLHQPIIGLSTHVHSAAMTPGINWESVNSQY